MSWSSENRLATTPHLSAFLQRFPFQERLAIRHSCDSCYSWLKKGNHGTNAHQPSQEESYRIVGACFEVYNELGSGFLEPVYQEALGIKFCGRSIPFVAKRNLDSEPQRDLCSLQ